MDKLRTQAADCPDCGLTYIDEDGCCATCGADAKEVAAVLMKEEDLAYFEKVIVEHIKGLVRNDEVFASENWDEARAAIVAYGTDRVAQARGERGPGWRERCGAAQGLLARALEFLRDYHEYVIEDRTENLERRAGNVQGLIDLIEVVQEPVPVNPPTAKIHFGGSDLTLETRCTCGHTSTRGGHHANSVDCGGCGKRYYIPEIIDMIPWEENNG